MKQGKKAGVVALLRQIASHSAKAVRLERKMLKTLKSIDDSIVIIAGQKKRELDAG